VNDSFRQRMRPPETARPAPVIGIRVESSAESRAGRLVRGAIAVGILICVAIAILISVLIHSRELPGSRNPTTPLRKLR
jgi:hypothetical protein